MLLLIVKSLFIDFLNFFLKFIHFSSNFGQFMMNACLEILGHHGNIFLLFGLESICILKKLFSLHFACQSLYFLLVLFDAIAQVSIFSKDIELIGSASLDIGNKFFHLSKFVCIAFLISPEIMLFKQ